MNVDPCFPSLAYLGPGGALTVIGSALALLAVIVVTFFGMVWYPVKRLLRWRRSQGRVPQPVPVEDPGP